MRWLFDKIEDHAGLFCAAIIIVSLLGSSYIVKPAYTPSPVDIKDAVTAGDVPFDRDTVQLLDILSRVTMVYTVGRVTVMEFCRKGASSSPWEWRFQLEDGRTIVLIATRCRRA